MAIAGGSSAPLRFPAMETVTERQPRYGPGDALEAPRYTGVLTFARCPNVRDPENVDVAIVGVPFDTGTSFRVGARFGPEACDPARRYCAGTARTLTSRFSAARRPGGPTALLAANVACEFLGLAALAPALPM